MTTKKRKLGNLLYHIGKLENLMINERLAPLNLRMSHAHVLRYIEKHPGCIQKEVAEYLIYQPASFTNVVKLLEKKQMIERRVDPNNRLKKRLYLLAAGKKVLKEVNSSFEELNEAMGSVDSDTIKKLEQISDNLERVIQKG
ncbi:MarR family winged helix-turn-helix transcriptional regulator [uncultured Lactobacillus sp.]|uniref:MarR family winged helix-turn-helix transcriptional regulator n=1 Tax=uncultured Lactobacillus sp. TaxID=153152 RepID=UPI0026109F3E|nr:MarR family transcriptional regulator [uncultured Lactobacillus sp.]